MIIILKWLAGFMVTGGAFLKRCMPQDVQPNITRVFMVLAAGAISACTHMPSGVTAAPANAHAALSTVDAAQFLEPEFMRSPLHRVLPLASSDGYRLTYTIETAYARMYVEGTQQVKTRIHEIQATDALRRRSTGGAILGSARDRTANLVETPYRIVTTLASRAGGIRNVEDAAFFVPEQVGNVAGVLLTGAGELVVTTVRIASGAAGTQCSGMGCARKAGADIWSGFNSLAGKHNAARRLHSEFGTDPETQNKYYRRHVDRLAYANAYTGTTIKIGGGQAGIDYLSPAFTAVGYYNNAEFVAGYEDAHRQRNREKRALLGWGADPRAVDGFYANKAFTKQYRRRLFKALDVLPDKRFAVSRLYAAANVNERYAAESQLAVYEYIAGLALSGAIAEYVASADAPLIISGDGTLILPLYADYLVWTPGLSADLQNLKQYGRPSALHVLGNVSPKAESKTRDLGITLFRRAAPGH